MKFLANFPFSLVELFPLRWEPSVWGSLLSILCSSWEKYDDAVNGFSFSLQDILESIFIFVITVCLGLYSLVCKSTFDSNLPSVMCFLCETSAANIPRVPSFYHWLAPGELFKTLQTLCACKFRSPAVISCWFSSILNFISIIDSCSSQNSCWLQIGLTSLNCTNLDKSERKIIVIRSLDNF